MSNILVVDDQPHVQQFLEEELNSEDYQVHSVGDVESLEAYLLASPPDLVLLDLYLDGFEGWSILNGIKRRDPNLPVLILTAYDSFRDDPRLKKAEGYIVKSFSELDALRKKIAEVINKKKRKIGREHEKNPHCG